MIIFILSILAIFISVHFILNKKKIIEGSTNNNNDCLDHGGLITKEQCKQFAVNKGFDVSNKAHYDNTVNASGGFWDGCQLRDDGKKIWFSEPDSTGIGGKNSSLKPICKRDFVYGQSAINAAPPVESNDKCSGRGGNLSENECLEYAKSRQYSVTDNTQYKKTDKPNPIYVETWPIEGTSNSYLVNRQTKKIYNEIGDILGVWGKYKLSKDKEIPNGEQASQAKKSLKPIAGLWNGCQISSKAPEEGKKPIIWFAAKDTTTPAKKYGSDATSTAICKNDFMGVSQTTAKTCNLKNCVAPIKVDGSCDGIAGQRNNNPIQKIINGYKKFFKMCEYKCLRPGPTNQPNYVDTGLWDKDANGDYKIKKYGTNSNYNKEIHGCRTKEDCSASCGKVEVETNGKMKEVTTNGEIKMVWEPEGTSSFFTQNRVGKSVKAKIDGSTTYVNGKIIKKNANGTFDIKFDNGVTKIGMKKSEFKGILAGSKCEWDKLQGLHNKECSDTTITGYVSLNGQEATTDTSTTETPNNVNAADTTMANMFLDINNPHDTGKKDMSLEDYYNTMLTIKNSENRLGGSKTAYTNIYRPQNKYGNIRFFNSIWKLF